MASQKFDRMHMIALYHQHDGNITKIASDLEVSRRAVREAIKLLPKEFFIINNEQFRQARSDMFATIQRLGIQELVRKLSNPTEAKKISPQQLSVLIGTMYDKERLENNLSTENIAHNHYQQLDDEDRQMLKDFIQKRTEKKLAEVRYDEVDEPETNLPRILEQESSPDHIGQEE